jgi:membrane protease YdiL (CAAX protease family)
VLGRLRDLAERLVERLLRAPWREIDARAAAARATAGTSGIDPRPLVVYTVAAFVLLGQYYWGDRPTFEALFRKHTAHPWFTLGSFVWWSGAKVVGYVVIPALVLPLLGMRLRDVGLGVAGFRRHVWIYGALFVAILPIVVAASRTQSFAATYPFYRLAARSWADFLAWEALYALSFLALEIFFRGFLLFTVERALGVHAIFVAVIPYAMIHVGKPVAESLGAIVAGVVLGTLALATRSVWCGVLIHVSVAWTMDILAMVRVYGWPGSGRFVG